MCLCTRTIFGSLFQRQAKAARRLNGTIFGGRLPPDLEVSWNARLKTTAGLTHYKRQLVTGAFR